MRDLLLPWVCYACIHTHFNGPLFGTTQIALEKRQLNGCCRSSNFGAICLLVLFMFFLLEPCYASTCRMNFIGSIVFELTSCLCAHYGHHTGWLGSRVVSMLD